MLAYLYPISLAAISLLLVVLEYLWPWRPSQRQLRPKLGWDVMHLVFNGHFLGVALSGVASTWFLPSLDRWLAGVGLKGVLYRGVAHDWPLWLQIPVLLLALDFIQWCVHNVLHRVPWLWETHKAHHSVGDGEMDWIVSFRFSWLEVVVYRLVQYLPLAYLGFHWHAMMVHAIFGTLIGHFNHANLKISWGPLRYVLNSPEMHIWHHDRERDGTNTVNFGIIFSMWDWIFGTAYMPGRPPAHLGFGGDESYPRDFFGQEAWPLQKLAPRVHARALWSLAGGGVLALLWYLHVPH